MVIETRPKALRPCPADGEKLSDRELQDHLNGVLVTRSPSIWKVALFFSLVLFLSPPGATIPYLLFAGIIVMGTVIHHPV